MVRSLRASSLAAVGLLVALCISACEDNGLVIEFPTAVDSYWWDGFAAQGMSDYVYVLAEYDGDLIAGGLFGTAGGQTVNGIARWDGTSWSSFGSGMGRDDCTTSLCQPWVSSLTQFEGDLVAGGRFTEAGGVPAANIARWDGATWSPLGDGLDDTVFALTEYQGRLIAGGIFTHSGAVSVPYLAQWSGSSWEPFEGGTDATVRALAVDGTDLVVGGDFQTAGFVLAPFLALWQGGGWTGFSPRLDDGVQTVQAFGPELIVGGDFYGITIDNHDWMSMPHVGAWNGNNWERLSGLNDDVSALATFRGQLIGGGAFSHGDAPAQGLARWDSNRGWTGFGTGLDRRVTSILEHEGHLYVGGWFRSAGGKPSRYIARWDGD